MSRNNVLLSFLPGFAPILIYILVDAFLGETAGLAAGIILGIGEFVFIFFREKRADLFTLADTALLILMGAVSLALSDPVFFKLKPAVSGAAISVVMIAGSLGPRRLFLPYMEKKMGQGAFPKTVADRMIRMLAGFGFLTLAHSALTAVAALWWSKAAWTFVAGALFWILALGYTAAWTLYSFRAARRARGGRTAEGSPSGKAEGSPSGKAEGEGEWLPIVNEEGRIIGKAPRPLCHGGKMLLHPVVRLWLSDGNGGWWMQKRSAGKLVQPGKWDCAVGGHVSFGETVEAALAREASEEIGLTAASAPGCLAAIRPLIRYIWETELERELAFVFAADLPSGSVLRADPAEVEELRRWSLAELKAELGKGEAGTLTGMAREELKRLGGA